MFYTEPNWTYRFSQNQLDADWLYLSSPKIEPFCPENLPQMGKSRNGKVLSMKKIALTSQWLPRIETTHLKTTHYNSSGSSSFLVHFSAGIKLKHHIYLDHGHGQNTRQINFSTLRITQNQFIHQF